jgi:glutathione S-transferase
VSQTARKLVSLHVSPWSERAKWALDHHGLSYEKVEHMPIIGERRLRRMVGPGKPRATVPVLLAGDEVLTESWDIALYADRTGRETKLVPPEHEAAIRGWVKLADEAMHAGRALVVGAMLESPAALDEGAPPFVPAALRPLLRPVTRSATRAFARKYDLALEDRAASTRTMRAALDDLRRALVIRAPYLLGTFTYADVVMATLLQGVAPVADRFIKLRPATRAAWTIDALASEYADLIAWRDGVYERERLRPPGPLQAKA